MATRIPARYAAGKIDAARRRGLLRQPQPAPGLERVAAGTRSLVLICHDFDVPSRGDDVNKTDREVPADLPRVDFFHWVMVDICRPASTPSARASSAAASPRAASRARQPARCAPWPERLHRLVCRRRADGGQYFGYDGPFPPFNDSLVHHYVFTLYAVSVDRLPVESAFTGAQVREASGRQSARRGHAVGHLHAQPATGAWLRRSRATRILAIRHGQTAWNADMRMQGQLDIALDDVGRWQAQRLARALADEAIDAVYSSDLSRARRPHKRWPARRGWRSGPMPACASAASVTSRA